MGRVTKNRIILAINIIAIIFIAAFIFMDEKNKSATGKQVQVPAVTSLTLKEQSIEITQELPGRTAAYKTAEIRPQVGGIITDRMFIEGAYVEKGQQLYQIDPAPYQTAYDGALAALSKAVATAKVAGIKASRYAELVKVAAVSKQDYDNAEASLAQAKADVDSAQAVVNGAKINLDYTKVYAPIAGYISKSSVTIGALVSANQLDAVASLTQLDPIYVDLAQSAEVAQKLRSVMKSGIKPTITLLNKNEDSAQPLMGELQFSEVTVDPTSDSVQTRAVFNNKNGELLPGMFVKANISYKNDKAILVPQKATMRRADSSLNVWVIQQDDTVKLVTINAQRAIGDAWLVTEGVVAGERIVIEGMQKIAPGQVVYASEMVITDTGK